MTIANAERINRAIARQEQFIEEFQEDVEMGKKTGDAQMVLSAQRWMEGCEEEITRLRSLLLS